MSDRNSLNLASVLYFAVIGGAFGAGIGWLALNSWLGIGFLVVGVILLIGLWAELDFLTDIATAVIEPAWRSIARTGQQLAGMDPNEPLVLGPRIVFGLAFLTGLAGVVLTRFSASEGGA